MRIKMQCPDCGKWFTLELAVKEANTSRAAADGGSARDEVAGNAAADASRSAVRPATVHTRSASPRERRSGWQLGAVPVVVVAVLVVAWFLWIGPALDRSRSDIVSETRAAQSGEVTLVEGEAEPGSAPVEPAAGDPDVVPVASAIEPREATGPLEFALVARDRCWVHIVADGAIVSDLTLEAGERRTWRAHESVELSVGSGEDIEIYLNGEYLGTAGAGPRVVEGLRVTSDGLASAD